jgi:hypothetical protein
MTPPCTQPSGPSYGVPNVTSPTASGSCQRISIGGASGLQGPMTQSYGRNAIGVSLPPG